MDPLIESYLLYNPAKKAEAEEPELCQSMILEELEYKEKAISTGTKGTLKLHKLDREVRYD